MRQKYHVACQKAMNQPGINACDKSREELVEAIAEINAELRGQLSNEERLMLVADRSELRNTLKAME